MGTKKRKATGAQVEGKLESHPNDGVDLNSRAPKRQKFAEQQPAGVVKHALLAQYYPQMQTLRAYIISNLPASSRIRRRKIESLGITTPRNPRSDAEPTKGPTELEVTLAKFMDSTLVARTNTDDQRRDSRSSAVSDDRREQWLTFSQKGDESYVTLSNGLAGALFSQSEIVDFVIWLLFERSKQQGRWPKHLLCDGYRRSQTQRQQEGGPRGPNTIPGLFSVYHNQHVRDLKEEPWPQLLLLLGKSGENMMIDLLMDCSIFLSLNAGQRNYYQLSGKPIYELDSQHRAPLGPKSDTNQVVLVKTDRSPTEITFVRSRMLYARAALNARGLVHFGLRHIHVLNRCPYHRQTKESGKDEQDVDSVNRKNIVRVMMYIFPRQFDLHNVFKSAVDFTKTAQKFQDYTLREEEITKKLSNQKSGQAKVPKRLRGTLIHLIERLLVRHSRCSYSELLQHYCPIERHVKKSAGEPTSTQGPVPPSSVKTPGRSSKHRRKSRQTLNQGELSFSSLSELATPIAHISAFCQAVLKKLLPGELWGTGEVQAHNEKTFYKNVDHFVKLRRFENMNLHEALQGMKIADIGWLAPPKLAGAKASQSDINKRKEIFSELMYYLFDSLLIPLIRSNFYVTESNIHRYRLFYFRHDIWRYVAEPAMAALKAKMFEEVKLEDALRILDSRQLGTSQVRLLPKGAAVRPIMNLRRRTLKNGQQKALGPSINSILGPVHTVLNMEKEANPGLLASTMFSVGDIYTRLKSFRQRFGSTLPKLYFAKVDVQGAFDTIPQEAVTKLMRSIPSQHQYKIIKHVELRPNESSVAAGPSAGAKSTRRWRSNARETGDSTSFREIADQQYALSKKDTVFVDSVVTKSHSTAALLGLLTSHVQQNLVRIGKKYYRQKDGIPQGSILSSILCNYFYADLELRHLAFLGGEDCLLLRLIDDFLLITTDEAKAARFVSVMHAGLPEYGVVVNAGKSLVNFDLVVDGVRVQRVAEQAAFPYCGLFLDCGTLQIGKDRENVKDKVITNALTVEYSRYPGQTFKRKVLNAFRIQSHMMFFDTTHNTAQTAQQNIYDAFTETAKKMWAYARCLPKHMQPSPGLVIGTLEELIDVAFLLLTSSARQIRYPGYRCGINKNQVMFLAMTAFTDFLKTKQSRYQEVLRWLEAGIAATKGQQRAARTR